MVPSINWNNFIGVNGTLPALLSDAGPTLASITTTNFEGVYTAHTNLIAGTPSADQTLTTGYIDNTNQTQVFDDGLGYQVVTDPATVTFSNLPFVGAYDVYVYMGSDTNGRGGFGKVVGNSTTYTYTTNTADPTGFDGTFTLATSGQLNNGSSHPNDMSEYMLFSGVTGNSFTFQLERLINSGQNTGLHGIQVVGVVPEPSSLVLAGMGLLSLCAIRRRRRK